MTTQTTLTSTLRRYVFSVNTLTDKQHNSMNITT